MEMPESSWSQAGPSGLPAPLGRVAILLRTEAFELRVPRLFGIYELVCEPSGLPEGSSSPGPKAEVRPCFNVLDAVVALPSRLRSDLGTEECEGILDRFRVGQGALESLEVAHGRPWIRETLAEVNESTVRILGKDPHFGESKWASLLGAERALKAFLVSRGQRASHTHQLKDLAQNAAIQGLVHIPGEWISPVQCSKGVRDGAPEVALEEAIAAQENSLRIIRHAVVGIPKPTE